MRGVRWYFSATEIPPAGAPPGGRGSLCGVVWLSRSPLHPVCRFAQDDTWVTGAWDEKQNAVLVRKVKHRIGQENKMPYLSENKTPYPFSLTVLYFTQNKLRITPLSPTCHLRANDFVIAAPPAKNHARPPTIAAQSNPAPSGAPAGGISVVKRYHIAPRTALCRKKPARPAKKQLTSGATRDIIEGENSSRRRATRRGEGRWKDETD